MEMDDDLDMDSFDRFGGYDDDRYYDGSSGDDRYDEVRRPENDILRDIINGNDKKRWWRWRGLETDEDEVEQKKQDEKLKWMKRQQTDKLWDGVTVTYLVDSAGNGEDNGMELELETSGPGDVVEVKYSLTL